MEVQRTVALPLGGGAPVLILCFVVGALAILSALLQVVGVIPKPPVGMRKGDLPLLLVGVFLSGWLGKSCAEARQPLDDHSSSSVVSPRR